ncbi:hypothetical protein [Thermincola ferriacetica]
MSKSDKENILKIIKYAKYGLGVLALSIVIYALLTTPEAGVACAVETPACDSGISIYPVSGFLKAPNIAPGDNVSAPLTVKNNGVTDFFYNVSAKKENGDDAFFNVLNLEIKDDAGKVLYSGKLKELSEIALGVLEKGQTDVLHFTVGFPAACGNEFQGRAVEVTFILDAAEHLPEI